MHRTGESLRGCRPHFGERFGAVVLAEHRTEDSLRGCAGADHFEVHLQLLEVTAEWLEAIFSSLEAVVEGLEARLPKHDGALKELEVTSSTATRR